MKDLTKRCLLTVAAIIIAVQAPFIYRRYKISELQTKISQIQTTRELLPNSRYAEYKGVSHVHTSLGGHSTGTFEELTSAADTNELDFVLMTEHLDEKFDTASLTLNGFHGKTLFVAGSEIQTANFDRFLVIPGGTQNRSFRTLNTENFLEQMRSENRLAIITHPEIFGSWNADFGSIEVFNFHSAAKQINPITGIFDLFWSYPAYPELTIATYQRRPSVQLKKFDEIALRRKITLFAGTDAHSNLGFHLLGDNTGNKLVDFKIDPYETIFRIARIHLLVAKDKPMNSETLIDALKIGRFFIGYDIIGDTTGFSFYIENGSGRFEMGDETQLAGEMKLAAHSPKKAFFVFFKDGEVIFDSRHDGGDGAFSYEIEAKQAGVYRTEVYLTQLGPPFDAMPWIISNPIYVR